MTVVKDQQVPPGDIPISQYNGGVSVVHDVNSTMGGGGGGVTCPQSLIIYCIPVICKDIQCYHNYRGVTTTRDSMEHVFINHIYKQIMYKNSNA